MIRVLVRASSSVAEAEFETLLKGHPGFHLLGNSLAGAAETQRDAEIAPDVLVVEALAFSDRSVQDAIDWAGAGGRVVLLLPNFAPEDIRDALRAGVKAMLSSNFAPDEIFPSIEAAFAGVVALDASAVETLLRAPGAVSHDEAPVEALTPREIEVLQLLASGLGNREIASRLKISAHTAKFHVASIMGKLGASTRTEAVTQGIRHGLILI
jgi:two-component system, NarL family, response regulator YdfI